VAELTQTLDAAVSLSAFNGVHFDLPIMQTALGLNEATVRAWVLKTTDILECCRLVHQHTFKLGLLCEENSLPRCHKRHLVNPRTKQPMDLASWSHPLLYDTLDALAWEEEGAAGAAGAEKGAESAAGAAGAESAAGAATAQGRSTRARQTGRGSPTAAPPR